MFMMFVLAVIYMYGFVRECVEFSKWMRHPFFREDRWHKRAILFTYHVVSWPIIWIKNAIDFHLDCPYENRR